MTCEKNTYIDQNEAMKAISGLIKRRQRGFFQTYYCNKCVGWHFHSGRKSTLTGSIRKNNKKIIQQLKNKLKTILIPQP